MKAGFMKILLCLSMGYLIGMISPSALFARRKKIDMRQEGTGNLGASNAISVLGRGYGVLIAAIDIFKAFFAAKAAQFLFPALDTAGFLAGLGAIIGHTYPFYLHFKGGKGLACFGGLVCFHNPWWLLFYLTGGVALMILANRSIFLPVFVAVTFPVIVLTETGDWSLFVIAVISGALLLFIHRKNFGRVKRGEEAPMRELVLTKVFKKKTK